MAIFSRRTLQRLINENAEFLRPKQTKNHVDKLNKFDLAAEWEVVLLNAFSKFGKVEHEKPFNEKKPDIYFISKENVSHEFLADIVTVSDKDIERLNPVNEFRERLRKVISENQIKGEWLYEIGGNNEGVFWKEKRTSLKLPALSRLDKEIFNERFEDFIQNIKTSPSQRRNYIICNETVNLSISYTPSKDWKMTGYISGYKDLNYENSLIRNSISGNLEAKYDQLTNTGYKGKIGILVCDGGSDYFLDKADLYSKNVEDIIYNFLNSHPEISFVISFEVRQDIDYTSSKLNVICTPYKGKNFKESDQWIIEMLEKFSDFFPEAVRGTSQAFRLTKWLLENKIFEGFSFKGAYSESYNQIKISARTVLELLAGRISQEDFFKLHDFTDEVWYKLNPFKEMMSKGSLISNIALETGENERDDDWLVITFGEIDAAISLFKVPESHK